MCTKNAKLISNNSWHNNLVDLSALSLGRNLKQPIAMENSCLDLFGFTISQIATTEIII